MQIIKPDVNIDFIGKRNIAYGVSLVLVLASLFFLVFQQGLQYGIDFAGGTLIQVKFKAPTSAGEIKTGLAELGFGNSSVQRFGEEGQNEYLIRTDELTGEAGRFEDQLTAALETATGTEAEIRRVEMVGPQVGEDLREKALLAIFFSLLFIAVYISGRFELKWLVSGIVGAALMGAVYFVSLFNVSMAILILVALVVTLALFWFIELKYAMGAIVALIHDVFITVGLFAILGKEFNLPIVAALLTIIGYSLNDTIIVFDRIRENQRKHSRMPLDFIINRSVNETLSRTLLTALTTLIVLAVLFLLGGGIIHDFAFAMIVGVVVGTYSSIYVASPILLAWQGGRQTVAA